MRLAAGEKSLAVRLVDIQPDLGSTVPRMVGFLTLGQFVHPAAKFPANTFRDRHLALMHSRVFNLPCQLGAAEVWPADGDDYVTA
jgi:hypothetical protein